jgi:hypothetical protein
VCYDIVPEIKYVLFMAAAPARAANNPDPLPVNFVPNQDLWIDITYLTTALDSLEPIHRFPRELTRLVAGYLKRDFFDADKCREFFGDPGPVPSLPANIDLELAKTNPFSSEKQIGDDFLFALVFATITRKDVNGQPISRPVTLNTMEWFAQNPLKGGKSQYCEGCSLSLAAEIYGNTASKIFRYVLLSKAVIPGSQDQSYDDQKILVAKKGGGFYQVPSAPVVVFVSFSHRLMTETEENLTGERLYSDVHTRCVEEIVPDRPIVPNRPLVVGFQGKELYVGDNTPHPSKYRGIGVQREFH